MVLNKKEKRELRELVSECYEAHLSDLLDNLYDDFQKWGGKYIDAFELTNRIHEFHDRKARELYSMYVLSPPEVAIIYALRNKIIGKEGIDKNLFNKLNTNQDIVDELEENEGENA